MAKFELGCNQVVKLRNGKIGIVVCFNDTPSHIVFSAFTNPVNKFDENLQNKNHDYDIVEVYDGSNLNNALDAFKKRTNIEENCELLYKAE